MSVNSTKSWFAVDRGCKFTFFMDYIYVKIKNLSNSEKILDVLVNEIKQIYHQPTFDSKIFYIELNHVLDNSFCGRLKKALGYVGRKGKPMATPSICL